MGPGKTQGWKFTAIFLIFCLALLACSLTGSGANINAPAPDFNLNTVGGRPVQLSQFKGRAVMVNFWATWCGPCRAELPLMQNRFEAHFPNLVVLAIEEGSTKNEIYKVMKETGVNFLVLQGNDNVLSQYGISAFPTTYLIDPQGIIRFHHVGQLSASQLDRALKELGLE